MSMCSIGDTPAIEGDKLSIACYEATLEAVWL